jgi:hypothetical protein
MIREYSRQPHGTFVLTGTDATILPENFQHPVIHPFVLTGISSVVPDQQGWGHPLTPRHFSFVFTLERCCDLEFRQEVDAALGLADAGTGDASNVIIDRYFRVEEVMPLSFTPDSKTLDRLQEIIGSGHNLNLCDNGWLMMNPGPRSACLLGFV